MSFVHVAQLPRVEQMGELIELGQDIVERVGDCSNLERKVNIRSILWETICIQNGLTLQKDHLTNKARIVDYISIVKMQDIITYIRQLKPSRELLAGLEKHSIV